MRLDNFLTENKYFDSRTKAKQAIERGEVFVDNRIINKASFEIAGEPVIKLVFEKQFVSLGGFKLDKALSDFDFDVNGLIVADIGASTGGFTDCLIKRGAKKVFSVDLRDDLLHDSLRNNNKVQIVVKNAKDLVVGDFSENIDLIVADLSFISVKQVLSVLANLISEGKNIIVLIKPQFETGKKTRYKNGIIRDEKIHKTICRDVYDYAITCGLAPQAFTVAPESNDKNKEFLILFEKGGDVRLENNFANKI